MTDDDRLHARALMYHDVAASRRADLGGLDPIVGVTCRLSELQGAVAGAQLRRLDAIIADCRTNRRALEGYLGDALRESGVALRATHDEAGDTGIALILLCPDVGKAKDLMRRTRAAGLRPLLLYDPDYPDFHVAAHWSPILRQRGWGSRTPWDLLPGGTTTYSPDRWARTTSILGRAVQLDVSPDLNADQIAALGSFIRETLLALERP